MKCEKCGYNDHGTGDFSHACAILPSAWAAPEPAKTVPLPTHPEPHTYQWTALEKRVIEDYGDARAALASHEPTEQLTVEVSTTSLPELREHLKIASVFGDPITLSSAAATELYYCTQDAARYAYVRTLHPVDFERLVSQNVAGVGKFDDLVEAGIAARNAPR